MDDAQDGSNHTPPLPDDEYTTAEKVVIWVAVGFGLMYWQA